LQYEFPEDDRIVPKHFGMINGYTLVHDVCTFMIEVKQSLYRPGVAQRVPGR